MRRNCSKVNRFCRAEYIVNCKFSEKLQILNKKGENFLRKDN